MVLNAHNFPHARPHIERALRNNANLPAYRDILWALHYGHVRGNLYEIGANLYAALQRELEDLAEGRAPVYGDASTLLARRAAAQAALDVARDVTDDEIAALRREAVAVEDTAQRIVCDMAIDGEDSLYDANCLERLSTESDDAPARPDYSGGGHSMFELDAIRRALRMSQGEARCECARMIAEASRSAT